MSILYTALSSGARSKGTACTGDVCDPLKLSLGVRAGGRGGALKGKRLDNFVFAFFVDFVRRDKFSPSSRLNKKKKSYLETSPRQKKVYERRTGECFAPVGPAPPPWIRGPIEMRGNERDRTVTVWKF
ncbi:hypothetical protein EVAR_79495_1 [Eumeta japonica]|uniref:Uncharacterized protein n=1 Tax=Eumeta variegata TaxID=151549 RepID=A0A4C1UF57_EUMVA|nr:hypothetical protein EVAR_79495_1 [Eumeta japonica]